MKNDILYFTALTLSLVSLCSAQAKADNAAPAAVSLSMPSMTGPLAGNSSPLSFDSGTPLGKIYVTGATTALALTQSNAVTNNKDSLADLSNAQVFVQNTDGPVQFFLQAGAYSIPDLGTSYLRLDKTTTETYGYLPQGYLKFVPNSAFNVQVGKLPTLFGAEYTFSFENMNIERGLLWNQENAVNRGVQTNYTQGPLALSLAWSDGFYSNRYNWLTGAATYTIDSADTLEFVAGGNINPGTGYSSFATPLAQNNGSIYNIIYTRTQGPWTFNPYLQYTYTPEETSIGLDHAGSTYGAAVLVKYTIDPNWSLAGRAEYIGSSGSASDGAPNLLYGAGSNAWSFTVTPTYQIKQYFGRVDASYVDAASTTAGDAFGFTGNEKSQGRLVLEAGVLF
jgi:hypothetical protein